MRPVSSEPAAPLRARPLVVADLFRGVHADSVRVTHAVPFTSAGGTPLSFEIYQPPRTGRFPVIVQIYGGAWQRGEPTSFANFAAWIASAGYVVIAIDYRHAPAAHFPAQLDDVDAALAWVRDHAAEYDGDASNVVLMGRSAGAHLALIAAYTPGPLAVRGVVSYYGPTDLVDAYRNPPRPDPIHMRATQETFIGGTPDQMPKQYADASPLSYVHPGLPPTLLVYGARDNIVEADTARDSPNGSCRRASPVAYLEIPWAGHAFDEVFGGPSSQIALYYTERFLARMTAAR